MDQPKKLNPAVAALIVIVLVAVAVAAAIALNDKSDSEMIQTTQSTPISQNTSPESSPSPTASPSQTSSYKDGSYTATGSYSTPGERESIELTIQITDGVISSSHLIQNAKTGEAKEYQAKFASSYKASVVGKSVDDVALSRTAGASLTSVGFNTALEKIKSDAAA